MLRWISPPVDNPPKPWRRRVFQWRYQGLCPWGSMGSLEDGFSSLAFFPLAPLSLEGRGKGEGDEGLGVGPNFPGLPSDPDPALK